MNVNFSAHLYTALDSVMPNTLRYSKARSQLARKLLKASLGTDTYLWRGIDLGLPPSGLIAGDGCLVNRRCVFETQGAEAAITLGNNVWIGHEVLMTVGSHEIGPPCQRAGSGTSRPILIGDGVWIGARAVILPGVTIGEGAVVAAGAVVNKDIPANTLYGGVPAKIIRDLPV